MDYIYTRANKIQIAHLNATRSFLAVLRRRIEASGVSAVGRSMNIANQVKTAASCSLTSSGGKAFFSSLENTTNPSRIDFRRKLQAFLSNDSPRVNSRDVKITEPVSAQITGGRTNEEADFPIQGDSTSLPIIQHLRNQETIHSMCRELPSQTKI